MLSADHATGETCSEFWTAVWSAPRANWSALVEIVVAFRQSAAAPAMTQAAHLPFSSILEVIAAEFLHGLLVNAVVFLHSNSHVVNVVGFLQISSHVVSAAEYLLFSEFLYLEVISLVPSSTAKLHCWSLWPAHVSYLSVAMALFWQSSLRLCRLVALVEWARVWLAYR